MKQEARSLKRPDTRNASSPDPAARPGRARPSRAQGEGLRVVLVTGMSGAGEFIAADPGFAGFFDGLTGLLTTLPPGYEREGKSYLTIALGCTGGRHRSVYIAERAAAWLRHQGVRVGVNHRNMERQ